MEKEELLSKINVALEGTKLQLSEQTLDAYAAGVVERVAEDVELTDDFAKSHADFLKSLNGNFHHDVANEINEYKAQHPKPQAKESSDKDDEVPEWGKAILKKFEDYEAEREATKVQDAKNSVLKSVKKDFVARQKQAGLEVRDYFLGNAMRELTIPDKDADVSKLSSELEKKYNQHLKAAGIHIDKPKQGNQGGGDGDPDVKALFAAKKARLEKERGN